MLESPDVGIIILAFQVENLPLARRRSRKTDEVST
jgi:hypothetical protein